MSCFPSYSKVYLCKGSKNSDHDRPGHNSAAWFFRLRARPTPKLKKEIELLSLETRKGLFLPHLTRISGNSILNAAYIFCKISPLFTQKNRVVFCEIKFAGILQRQSWFLDVIYSYCWLETGCNSHHVLVRS